VERPPAESGWVHEIKFDGYRVQLRVAGGVATLLTRKGLDWTDRMPAVAYAFKALDVRAAMLDGELVTLPPDGVSSFPALQAPLSRN
jgi:bifunctional non-homologous end joining protein LigD